VSCDGNGFLGLGDASASSGRVGNFYGGIQKLLQRLGRIPNAVLITAPLTSGNVEWDTVR